MQEWLVLAGTYSSVLERWSDKPEVVGWNPIMPNIRLTVISMERCPSGLWCLARTQVASNRSGVRILHAPSFAKQVMGEQKKITSQWYPVEKSGTIVWR